MGRLLSVGFVRTLHHIIQSRHDEEEMLEELTVVDSQDGECKELLSVGVVIGVDEWSCDAECLVVIHNSPFAEELLSFC